jgi:hypothetical protein
MPIKEQTVKGPMSINTDAAASSMHESNDFLRETPQVMHLVWFEIENTKTWYAVMSEARKMFGRNWRTQKHVKRKLNQSFQPVTVWFEVPDEQFGTWIAVKYAVVHKLSPYK